MLPAYSGLSLANLMQALISSKEVGFTKLHAFSLGSMNALRER